jgi:hypothetical protein
MSSETNLPLKIWDVRMDTYELNHNYLGTSGTSTNDDQLESFARFF